MGILRYADWKDRQDALAHLEAFSSGEGKLFEFGDPTRPDYVAMAPSRDGAWLVKSGGHPVTAVTRVVPEALRQVRHLG